MHITELSNDQLVYLWQDDGRLLHDETEEILLDVVIVEEGEWVDEGKCSVKEVVVRDNDGKHYSFFITRTGSYYSFYDFQCIVTAKEVEKVTETITVEKWVLV